MRHIKTSGSRLGRPARVGPDPTVPTSVPRGQLQDYSSLVGVTEHNGAQSALKGPPRRTQPWHSALRPGSGSQAALASDSLTYCFVEPMRPATCQGLCEGHSRTLCTSDSSSHLPPGLPCPRFTARNTKRRVPGHAAHSRAGCTRSLVSPTSEPRVVPLSHAASGHLSSPTRLGSGHHSPWFLFGRRRVTERGRTAPRSPRRGVGRHGSAHCVPSSLHGFCR